MDGPSGGTFAVNGVVANFGDETLRDRAGTPIPLRPQAFSVLRYLAANPNRLVAKDELMGAVWRGVAVTDDSLVQCISDIRRAIGDDAHAVLKTVPRRGYRLVMPDTAADVAARPRRKWAAAAALAAILAVGGATAWWLGRSAPPAASVPLIAVLPFDAVTADESTRLLARGLTEDVITDLGRMDQVGVMASGATEGYRGADPQRAGVDLKAAFVVRGSIARDGDRVRVTAQLIDTQSGRSLWSERWDRPAGDFFAVQAEVAETLANRIGGGAGVVLEAGRDAARRKPSGSLNAYELYVLANEELEKNTVSDVQAGIALLERAIEIDPGFARPWQSLSGAHTMLADHGVAAEKNRAAAREAAERALALDPGDAWAHAAAGWQIGVAGDLAHAKAEYDTALRLAPNAATILTEYAAWASTFGEAERGAAMIDRAIRLEPNFPASRASPYAYAYFMAGRNEEALAMIDRLAVENYFLDTWAYKAGALAALGRLDEARTVSAAAVAAQPAISIEYFVNHPGYSEVEHQRFIDNLRPAGFPACAPPGALAKIDKPRRLPECEGAADARPASGGSDVASE